MLFIVFHCSRNDPLLADNEQASIVLIDSGLPEVALQQGAMMKTAKLLKSFSDESLEAFSILLQISLSRAQQSMGPGAEEERLSLVCRAAAQRTSAIKMSGFSFTLT